MRCGFCAAIGVVAALAMVSTALATPQINEVMAANVSTLPDADGTYADWIEIANPGPEAVSLDGWFLTDDRKDRAKWRFPAATVPPGGYLVVFASGKNRRESGQPLHANFRLEAKGEYIGLFHPDGTLASELSPGFPAQPDDVSYGLVEAGGGGGKEFDFLREPTPGSRNTGRGAQDLSDLVSMSHPPGPFSMPFDLVLSGAESGQKIRYVITAPSSFGAQFPEPTEASPEYAGPLRISSTVMVRAAVFSNDGLDRGPVSTAHFLQLGQDLAGFATKLPVIVLDNLGEGPLSKDGIDHPAWLHAYASTAGSFPADPEVVTPATMAVRGNFSASFPKSTFTLTLLDDDDNESPQALLGLPAHEDWVLGNPWLTDRSYIRNAFVYALSNRIGRWAPRTRFVETFVNQNGDGLDRGDYFGIGVLTEKIKIGPERVDIAPLDSSENGADSITGGYIVKLDVVPDPDHFNFTTTRGIPARESTAVVVYAPKASKLSTPQREYIRDQVQQMENALFADASRAFGTRTYLDYIDVPSWVDHHILELFVANVDGLYRSEYFSKDRDGKFVSGPVWDFDGSMGNGDYRNEAWDTWDTADDVDLWNYGWFGQLTHDPEFMQAWIDRWQALRRDEFANRNLVGLADSLAAEVGTDAAARDAARWPENQSRYPGGFLGEVAHLKNWITNRAGWIDRQFVAAPTVTESGGSLIFTAAPGVQLAHTLDGTDPRSLGGAIAPNAVLASSPLVVPAGANVHVRGYRADLVGIFPGSPWSSAVSGAGSSPLLPQARLVNLSSRAQVGSGDDTLIAGVTIADTAVRRFVARAVGPSLAHFGTTHPLMDPVLTLYAANGGEILRNSGWQNSPDAAMLPGLTRNVGAFPLAPGSGDSARVASLPSGGYTLHVSSSSGQSGIGLAELYPCDRNGRTLNLSIRARVRTGDGALIGGFVLEGSASKRMLVRAVGPTLSSFGVAGALADPVVTIYSAQTVVAVNDDWSSAAERVNAATVSVGAFRLPENSRDSGLLVTLPAGAYTVEVSGKNSTEGVALLEIYAVP